MIASVVETRAFLHVSAYITYLFLGEGARQMATCVDRCARLRATPSPPVVDPTPRASGTSSTTFVFTC